MGEKLKEEWEKKILAERENKKEEKKEKTQKPSILLEPSIDQCPWAAFD